MLPRDVLIGAALYLALAPSPPPPPPDAYEFALITDLDLKSADPERPFVWRALLKTATARWQGGEVQIEWGRIHTLHSSISYRNRSMEMSELVRFQHYLLGFCDITGIGFKLALGRHGDRSPAGVPGGGDGEPKVLQRWAIADGAGDSAKPFKTEWGTVKGGLLWVGSTGKEWTTADGAVLHRNNQWVKTIDRNGRISNHDWRPQYAALRRAANATFPGYLWHEAVCWDAAIARWIFLPRKASHGAPYHPIGDERMGTNLLLLAAEDFSHIEVRRLGPVEPEYGFSALRKFPGSRGLYIAVKVREVGAETSSKLVVFDLDGRIYLDLPFADDKYEGVEFLRPPATAPAAPS